MFQYILHLNCFLKAVNSCWLLDNIWGFVWADSIFVSNCCHTPIALKTVVATKWQISIIPIYSSYLLTSYCRFPGPSHPICWMNHRRGFLFLVSEKKENKDASELILWTVTKYLEHLLNLIQFGNDWIQLDLSLGRFNPPNYRHHHHSLSNANFISDVILGTKSIGAFKMFYNSCQRFQDPEDFWYESFQCQTGNLWIAIYRIQKSYKLIQTVSLYTFEFFKKYKCSISFLNGMN